MMNISRLRKSLLRLSSLFFSIFIHCMNAPVENCPMALLIPDIAQRKIQPLISYQDIGRLKQCSSWCDTLYDVATVCYYCCTKYHQAHPCAQLATNYYVCSKALGYSAATHNKKMFLCLWQHHEDKRDFFSADLYECMAKYRMFYNSPNSVKENIMCQVLWRLHSNNNAQTEGILSGSNLDSIGSRFWPVLKKIMDTAYGKSKLFVIEDLCFGLISPETVPFIMEGASIDLIEKLIEIKMLNVDTIDRYNNTLLHHAVSFERDNVISLMLEKGVYVNVRNADGETALHWAVKNSYADCVIKLLNHPDISVNILDDWGRKPAFYVSRQKILCTRSFKKTAQMKLIKKALNNHKKKYYPTNALRYHGHGYNSLK